MTEFVPWLAVLPAAVAAAWFSFRFAWWRRAAPYETPRILMYHMVRDPLPGGRFNKMRVSPALFRRQVEWLAKDGWTFCFLSELLENPSSAPKRVALTFDDGYRDNLTNALPVLREFHAKATLFPVVKRDEGYDWSTQKKASHGGGELGREPKLSDDEIREMLASGLVELGGHSLTHANLPALGDDEARREIAGCKEQLEATFGVRVPTFCYPFGLFGDREARLCREAGYLGATTTEQGVGMDDPFALPRIKVSGSEGMFAFRLRLRTGKRN
ncbi:MAG: polysaccharide deacetylase family protein [Akkermansiaceae bacterium]|nr:polysaccharide deacetylase family protein [Akkermansiaceae bacterium]